MGHPIRQVYDDALLMHDGVANITADGGGVVDAGAAILDLGAGQLINGMVVLEISALDVTTGDEKYNIHIQGSNSATFASGISQLAQRELGDDTQILADADAGVGRYLIPFVNLDQAGNVLRYVRIYFDVSGTTPILTGKAFLTKAA